MTIAYFVNHYPKVSHSFIRREILALERNGIEVKRIALHGWNTPAPDTEDRRERDLTHYILRRGIAGLLFPTLLTIVSSPLRFFQSLVLAFRVSRKSRERPLIYHLAYLAEACALQQTLQRAKVTHIHAHFGTNSAEIVMLAKSLGGPPYSFTVHGPDEFMQPMCLAEKVARSVFVVAISSFTRSQLYLRLPSRLWPKVQLVRCGLEPSFYSVRDRKPTGIPRLVCIGRLCEAKGQLLLIRAAAQLLHKGIAFELVLAGDGPLRAEIESSILQLGIGKSVTITGWIDSATVRDRIQESRALVLPSFAEGLPVVIMEAFALRRPVLSTYVAGIPELVKSGENGFLFPAGSVDALRDAIEAFLALPAAEVERLGDAGYDAMINSHTIDSEAARLAELIRLQPEIL